METLTAPAPLAAGDEIAGTYRLQTCLASSAHHADYETIYRGTAALIRLFNCSGAREAAALRTGFELAMKWPHSGLMTVYDFGEHASENGPIAWVVMERPEECLGDILRDRTLDEAEARQVLESLVPPLEFLLARELDHGAVCAANIYACGDTIKLSADRMGAVTAETSAPQIAELILEMLTGSPNADAIPTLNSPFRELAAGRFPDLAKVKSVLAGEEAAEALEPAPIALPESDGTEPEAPVFESFTTPQPKYRKYAGLAVGGVVAAAIACALLISGAQKAPPAPVQAAPVNVPAAPVEAPRAKQEQLPRAPEGWAILAGWYSGKDDAARRASELLKARPRIDAKVYSTDNPEHPFALVLAAGLTEAQAKKQLQRLRRSPVARSSSVIKFD